MRKSIFAMKGKFQLSVVLSIVLALFARAEFTCELSFPSAPAAALENFPVLVRLAEDAPIGFSYGDCPDADSLWFTDADENAVPFEVDTWNDAGESLVWVSVASLSPSATITMHWDSAGAPAGLPDSALVWSRANYVGVWHMNEILEDGAGKHYTPDSSASGWNAYKANEDDAYPVIISDASAATTAPPTGRAMVNQLGDSQRKTGGFIVPSTLTSGTTIGPFTVSLFEENSSGNNDRAFAIGGTRGNQWENGCLTANKNTTYVMSPNSGHGSFTYGDSLADNAWRHIAGVFNTTLAGYVGGVYKNPNKSNVNPVTTLNYGIGLGTFVNHTETFTGYLDEIRIRNVASTGEWIAEEYTTVTSANYVSFGDVEGGSGIEYLKLGTPTVSEITAVSATVSGRLTKLGDGATSASVALFYTDGTVTNSISLGSTNAVPAAFSVLLANLAPSTAYTAWFSAINDATPPASTNSVATAFSTGADATEWNTASATFTPDGRTITASIDITNVGSGTSTLYLMKGSGATATVAGSAAVTSAGTKTVSGDFSDLPWGSRVYYSLMLVNGTAAGSVTNSYNPNAYKDIQDNSTYTWIGGSSGIWTNDACWSCVVGNLAATHPAGHPVSGSTAVFATAAGDDPVTVTLPDIPGDSMENDGVCWRANTLNLSGMHEPLVFTSQTTNWTSRLYIHGVGAENNYNRLVFDHAAAKFYAPRFMGAATTNALGENFTVTFKNGASGNMGNWNLERPGVKLRVETGSRVIAGNFSAGASAAPAPVFEVDDSAFELSGQYAITMDTHGANGLTARISGAKGSLSSSGIVTGKANSTNTVEFVIPEAGYDSVPLRLTASNRILGGDGTTAPVTLKVSRDSPGLGSISRRGIQLVQSAAGVNASNIIFQDVKPTINGFFFKDEDGNEYANYTAITNANKAASQITQIWYRSQATPLRIYLR